MFSNSTKVRSRGVVAAMAAVLALVITAPTFSSPASAATPAQIKAARIAADKCQRAMKYYTDYNSVRKFPGGIVPNNQKRLPLKRCFTATKKARIKTSTFCRNVTPTRAFLDAFDVYLCVSGQALENVAEYGRRQAQS